MDHPTIIFPTGAQILRFNRVADRCGRPVGGIVPQPYLNDVLRFTIYGLQDVVHEAKQFTAPSEGHGATTQTATAESTAKHAANNLLRQSPDSDLDQPEVSKVPESPLEPPNAPTSLQNYWTPEWKYFDKKEHILSFYFLALVSGIAYSRFGWRRTLMGLITLSSAIQSMQSLTITREFGFDDMAADLIGIAFGFGSATLAVTLWRRRLLPSQELL